MPTFEEQMSNYDFKLSEEDFSKLQEIYISILNSENNGNYEHVDSQWELFYTILQPYLTMNESIPFRALQVIIDGVTFVAKVK